MAHRKKNHRPIRGGIGITPHPGMPQMGTLTAVARRIHDNALVFVTNTHVVSPGVPVTIGDTTATDRYAIDDENAFVYQFLPNESEDATDAEANRVGQLY